MMLFAAFSYFICQMVKEGFVHPGFTTYLRIELGTAKILGIIALLLPMIPAKIKKFPYSGFTITFISAFIAHLSSGDPVRIAIKTVVALVILIVSYIYYTKIAVN